MKDSQAVAKIGDIHRAGLLHLASFPYRAEYKHVLQWCAAHERIITNLQGAVADLRSLDAEQDP